jgi:PadR family transcriptional regulator, regulatory protein PadR
MKGRNLGEFEELVLLAVRGLGDEATGSTIQEVIRDTARRRASLGAIYAALDRGHRKGLVESWLEEPGAGAGGRARRHYRLTASGERALRESRRVREAMWRAAREARS